MKNEVHLRLILAEKPNYFHFLYQNSTHLLAGHILYVIAIREMIVSFSSISIFDIFLVQQVVPFRVPRKQEDYMSVDEPQYMFQKFNMDFFYVINFMESPYFASIH